MAYFKKRAFPLFMALVMIISMLPMNAFAAEVKGYSAGDTELADSMDQLPALGEGLHWELAEENVDVCTHEHSDDECGECEGKGYFAHVWGEPQFTWAEDYTCTALVACVNNEEHTKTLSDVVVTSEVVTEPKCTAEGVMSYTASVVFNGETYTDTTEGAIEKKAHDYSADWVYDKKPTCTAAGHRHKLCQTCWKQTKNEYLKSLGHDMVPVDAQSATCTEAGWNGYTKCQREGCTHTENYEAVGALDHAWGEPAFDWSEDLAACTATFTCERGCKETVECTVTSETTDATCTADGETVYTATVTFDDTDYSDTETESISALGHEWGEPEFDWNEDHTACTATFTCANGCEETVDCTVTSETTDATCTAAGETVYTATVTFDDTDYSETETESISALGHEWGEPEFDWNEDHTACTAIFTCANGCEETADCTVTSETTDATCTAAGETVYTATVTFDDTDYSETETESISALGHEWGEPEFDWNEDHTACTATFTCANGCEETADCTVTSETTDATCTAGGETVYTAAVTFDGTDYTDTETESISALGHEWGEWKDTSKQDNHKHYRTCERGCVEYCTHTGEWTEGDCKTAKACKTCGWQGEKAQYGEHNWADQENSNDRKCTICGKTCNHTKWNGKTKFGKWEDGVRTCSDCGKTETCDHKDHKGNSQFGEWKDGSRTCNNCGLTETCTNHSYTEYATQANGANSQNSSHHYKKCAVCGKVDNNSKEEHTWVANHGKYYHWEECVCGAMKNEGLHYGYAMTGVCWACGHEEDDCEICQRNSMTLSAQSTSMSAAPELPADYCYDCETCDENHCTHICDEDCVTNRWIVVVNTYEVKFIDQNGKQVGETQIIEHGKSATAPSLKAPAGYKLVWDKEFSKITKELTVTASNERLYGTYSISLFVGWGKTGSTKDWTAAGKGEIINAWDPLSYSKGYVTELREGAVITEKTPDAVTLVKDGIKYTVGGDDYYTIDGGSLVAESDGYHIDYQATFYHTVRFEGVDPITVQHNGAITSMPQGPAKEGYTFDGWDVEEDALKQITNSMEIKAKWTVNQHTITFDTDGGSYVAPIAQDYGTAVTAPADPTKEGYTFAGWDSEIPGTMPAEDLTIKAQWTVNQYTISFDTDGGSYVAPIAQGYGTAVTAPADPTKEGYTFAGWDSEIPETMPAEDLTIKAQWTVNQYTISFDTDGGSYVAPITQNYGTAVTVPADPTKEGHTFAGWDSEIPGTMPAEDLTIKAQWTVNQYTISFDTDGGSEIAPITQDYGTAVTAPADPTKEGYTFAGWDTKIPGTMPAKNVEIKALWTINQYTISFDTDGGSEIAPITQNYGTAVTAPADPTRTGYTFAGWDSEIPGTMPAEDLTIKAKWTVNQYTITFDANGGSETAPITQNYGTAVTAPADPTKEGYTFAGWDSEIPETMPAEDLTIKAQWTVNQYTITFDANGGSETAPITQNYGTAVTAPADPTKEGYTFAGWDSEIPGTMPAEDLTIKAQWTVNQYTISFDANGGSETAPITQNYGTAVTAPADPTRTGYTFAGWDTEIPSTMPAENMTVKALWTINQYTIIFNTGDGTPVEPITQDYGTKIGKVRTPSLYGYEFMGWDVEIPETMPAMDMTITALWVPVNDDVTPGQPEIPDDVVEIDEEEVPLADGGLLNTEEFVAFINGFEDATVRPEKNITRAEFVTIMFRLLNDDFRLENWGTESRFADVDESDWFFIEVTTCDNIGMLDHYDGENFEPNKDITRAEVAYIVALFIEDAYEGEEALFTDIAESFAFDAINDCKAVGLIDGYEGKFRPNDTITRAEVAKIVNNLLGRDTEELLGDLKNWTDNPESKWYFDFIRVASNSFDSETFEVIEIDTDYWKSKKEEWAAAFAALLPEDKTEDDEEIEG